MIRARMAGFPPGPEGMPSGVKGGVGPVEARGGARGPGVAAPAALKWPAERERTTQTREREDGPMGLERACAFAPGAVLAVSVAALGVAGGPGTAAVIGASAVLEGVVGKMSES